MVDILSGERSHLVVGFIGLASEPDRAQALSSRILGARHCRAHGRTEGDAATSRPVTDRQIEILTNVARGRTNRQIGEALGISEKTVRNHLRTISHKLSASDRTHAVVLAIGNGWIAIPIEPDGDQEMRSAPIRREAGSTT